MTDDEIFKLVCKKVNHVDANGGHVIALAPRSVYDSSICGSCSHSNRLIYSEYDFLDLLTKELIKLRNFEDWFLAPEVYERFQDEAISLYTQFLLNLAYVSPLAPIFLNDNEPAPEN